ncbi:MAG: hypothetical protein ABI229_06190 [Gemmatimonadaceae bacterium]
MRAFVVTNGAENIDVLALFTSKEAAEEYRDDFARRRLQRTKATPRRETIGEVNERKRTEPKVIEVPLDQPFPELPGAWRVRIDSRSRTILSAKWEDKIKSSRKAKVDGKGKFSEAEGYGAKIGDAYYSARKAIEELIERQWLDSLERDQD